MIRLSDDDVQFFIQEGYVIKRGVLDPELMAYARDQMWANAPAPLKRDDPDSWVGPFTEESEDRNSVRHGFTWKYREQGGQTWMVELMAKNPAVRAMAEQLLGEGSLAEPERVRGIYCMLPEGDAPARPYRCHVDAHPFHLGVVGYIDDVEPNGGGFTVWPGSHCRFYPDFHSQYKHEPTEQYQPDLAEVNQQPYVSTHGRAGDIIFWHHRIGHSAGHNRSRRIRQAILYDFKREDLADRLDTAPQADMWHDWAGIQSFLAESKSSR